jgi:hypothetical protein
MESARSYIHRAVNQGGCEYWEIVQIINQSARGQLCHLCNILNIIIIEIIVIFVNIFIIRIILRWFWTIKW